MIKKVAVGIVLALALFVGGAYAYRNIIVEGAVEEGSEFALGVETDLGSASLNISGGALALDDFVVDNPEGFNSDYFFKIEEGLIKVNTGSIFDDEVVVETFTLRGISLNLEQTDGSGNYSGILNHIKGLDMGSSSGSETKLRIQHLAIEDIAVSASLTALGEERFNKEYVVDGFTMTNLAEESLTIADLSGVIFEKIISKSAQQGGSLGFDPGAEFNKATQDVVEKAKSEVSDQLKKLGIGGK